MSTATPGRPGTIGPWINGPLQDVFAKLLTQQGTPCENFELNYNRCVEAYGHILAKRYCDLELRDFYECYYHTKRGLRFYKIRKERMRQFLNGDRDRPFEEEKVPFYASGEDYFSHNRVWAKTAGSLRLLYMFYVNMYGLKYSYNAAMRQKLDKPFATTNMRTCGTTAKQGAQNRFRDRSGGKNCNTTVVKPRLEKPMTIIFTHFAPREEFASREMENAFEKKRSDAAYLLTSAKFQGKTSKKKTWPNE